MFLMRSLSGLKPQQAGIFADFRFQMAQLLNHLLMIAVCAQILQLAPLSNRSFMDSHALSSPQQQMMKPQMENSLAMNLLTLFAIAALIQSMDIHQPNALCLWLISIYAVSNGYALSLQMALCQRPFQNCLSLQTLHLSKFALMKISLTMIQQGRRSNAIVCASFCRALLSSLKKVTKRSFQIAQMITSSPRLQDTLAYFLLKLDSLLKVAWVHQVIKQEKQKPQNRLVLFQLLAGFQNRFLTSLIVGLVCHANLNSVQHLLSVLTQKKPLSVMIFASVLLV